MIDICYIDDFVLPGDGEEELKKLIYCREIELAANDL